MKISFSKGFRNKYKYPFGAAIHKVEILPFGSGKFMKKMRRINFRYKHRIFSIFINWNRYDKDGFLIKS